MEEITSDIVRQILTSAGFAGALLLVLGWAYWKKDRSEKATQVALVKQEKENSKRRDELHTAYALRIEALGAKRVEDAQRVNHELMELAEKQMTALQAVAVTNTEVTAYLTEIRREIRHRNDADSI